jgi:small subunit ribosomal protein S20
VANHRSAEKRNRQNQERNARNRGLRSRVRRAIRLAREAVANKSENREALVKEAVTAVYTAASQKILASGTASRTVSRLMKSVNA